ncbi:rhomboid family intramembrane serine protease [Ulvibacter litoralis]|uniref:Membrane associated serine protease, rhomboid family n=1 Tax=Ulvibacter litoralis TaxID=227084 RepID=A0A1G7BYZ4_9FLAO|nr:rhomboid family intramembrane serine protease [Ulvibacter litoralis]GHC49237.1 rhomboid family intramembrane serine protease [Ulvibacter litoralis]SDE32324.1 Membrane associated serine protease, rhomboid family [Ulvibacter litoralis]
MSKQKGLFFSNDVILYPIAFVLLMWLVFWAEIRFNWDFNYLGIYPRKISGLVGIALGPFIHGNLKHLFNNSIPIFVLSTALFYFYRNIRWKVLLLGVLLCGLFTWIIGRPSYHIGASGVVYMLTAFLFFKGIFSKQYQLIALSLVVVFVYGGLLWYVLPIDPKISWEGHLSGFGVGLLLALVFREIPIETKKYAWERDDFNPEEDDFIKQFDENGNFIEKEKVPEIEEETPIVQKPKVIRVVYTFKKNTNEEESSL